MEYGDHTFCHDTFRQDGSLEVEMEATFRAGRIKLRATEVLNTSIKDTQRHLFSAPGWYHQLPQLQQASRQHQSAHRKKVKALQARRIPVPVPALPVPLSHMQMAPQKEKANKKNSLDKILLHHRVQGKRVPRVPTLQLHGALPQIPRCLHMLCVMM